MNLSIAALAFVLLIGTFDSASSQDCDVTATARDAASSEQELQDVLLLQVGRNLSNMALHELLPAEKVSPDRKTEKAANRTVKPWTEPPALIFLASEVKELSKLHLVRRASSFGGFLLWLIIVVLLLGAIGYLVFRYLTTKRRDQTGQSASSGSLGSTMGLSRPSAPATERLLTASGQEDSAQRGSVPPPILCKQLILQDHETRFVVDCSRPLQDPDTNQFEVKSPNTGTVLLEGEIHNNILLSLHKKGSKVPHVMLQCAQAVARGGNRAQDVKPMFSILDQDGAYFGKIAEAASGTGVVLYHKNRPSCMIKAVEKSSCLEISASALQNPGGGWVAQSKIDRSSGSVSMNFQARAGVDATLFLGIFLAMTMIEPKLMQMAMKSELRA